MGSVRGPAPRIPRRRVPRWGPRSLRGGGHHVWMGSLRRRLDRHRSFRRQRARGARARQARHQRRQHRRQGSTAGEEGIGDPMDRLNKLFTEFGQSPWLDNLKRGYITSGQLQKLVHEGIRGLTSNPTIFQKAIQGSPDYDEQFRTLVQSPRQSGQHKVLDDYWSMVLQDINSALDVLEPVYDESDGVDGYASVEVDPGLANDTAGTIAAARELHERVARKNLMVKIPATAAGVPAIKQMISEGRNINVTLI